MVSSKSLAAMAVLIFSMSNTVVVGDSLPEPTIQRPLGATSTPCGDLARGMKYAMPGASAGSITGAPPIFEKFPAAIAFSASR